MRVFVIVTLVVLALGRDEAFFASLRETEFGKTIIQTIQLQLSQEHPADTVVHLLKQMKDDLNNEQRVDDDEIKGKQESCQGASTDAQNVIQVAAEKKAIDDDRLPLVQQEQNDKRSQLESKQSEEQRNLDRIALLTAERAVQKKEYEERRDELVGLISALQEAKQILSQGLGLKKNSFVELKDHYSQFLKYFPNRRGFHSLVELMLQMMQNSSAADKVIEIIDTLVDSIFQVQKEEMKADDGREQDFLNQKERFLLSNRRLEGSLAELIAQSERLGQKILEIQTDIDTQIAIISGKTTEKKDWDQTCSDFDRVYRQQKDQRKGELEIIVECIDIFETRFDQETGQFIQRIRV